MSKVYDWIERLWQWIAKTVFVRFEFDLPVDRLRELAAAGRVVFVLTGGGFLEWLILSSWCRTQGFGAILMANRKRVLFFSQPKFFFQILFRQKTYADLFLSEASGMRLLYVRNHERKKLYQPTPSEQVLCEMYAKWAPLGRLGELNFMPLFVLWRKHTRGGSRLLSEYLLGLSSNPNWIGKFWYLLRRRSDSTIRALDAFPMAAPEGESVEGLDDSEAMRVAKSTRRKLLVQMNQEMRVVLGPRYNSAYAVKETLLRDADIQRVIAEVAEKEGIDRRKVMSRAYANLTEIVGAYRFRFIEVMYVLLTWLFTKVFDGLIAREEEVHTVRETMKTKPVVYVSCHRSHLDYLVIPYLLFLHNVVTPYIAAGVNLAFWPVGYFLRQGGAFFIRRSFRGDPLYSICLKKYVDYLLRNRFTMMFFIEGTRSRSGKMLAPAYGMLKMVMETVQRKQLDDIALVPVSICYDEVPEQGSYTKELAGGTKVKESARELLKSGRIIQRRFGMVYVRMAPALHAKDADGNDPLALQKTAFLLCKNINDVTPVTPKSLVSSVFLGHVVPQVSLEELLRLSLMLGKYVLWSGKPLSVDLASGPQEGGFRRAVEQTVRRLQKSSVVNVAETVPRSFFCENRKRILLNYYKNNAIHCLVMPSILMLAFFFELRSDRNRTGAAFLEGMYQTALRLRNILKFEFFFSPTTAFLAELERDVEFFFGKVDWKTRKPEDMVTVLRAQLEHWNDVSVYLRLLGELVESYATAAQFILKEGGSQPVERKAFVAKIVKYAETRNLHTFPESISIQNYTNAVQLFENLRLINSEPPKEPGGKSTAVIPQPSASLQALVDELQGYLDLMQKQPEVIVDPTTEVIIRQ